MVHELKIIMGSNINGIDAIKTKVFLDEFVIGCIQNIKIDIGVNGDPKIEITFPNFKSKNVNNNFKTQLTRDIDWYVEILSKIPNVKIILEDISIFDDKLEELSTDGFIETIDLNHGPDLGTNKLDIDGEIA